MRNQLTSEDIFFLNVEKEHIKFQVKIYIDRALEAYFSTDGVIDFSINGALKPYFSEQDLMASEPKRLFIEFITPALKKLYGRSLDECVKFMLGEPDSRTFMPKKPDIPTLDKCMVESLRGLIITGFNEYKRDLEDARRKQAEVERKQAQIAHQQRAEIARKYKAELARKLQVEIARTQQAELARKQQAAFTPISNAIVNNIATLVDGNNASYKDVVNTGFESENATIEIYVEWGFAWDHDHISIPGGNSASIHFGNDSYKFNAHAENSRAKIDHAYYISSYLDSIEAKASAGMLEVNTRQHTIFTGKYFSYRRSCDSCAGRGSVGCSGCGGGGRMTCPSCSGGGMQSYLQPVTSSNGTPNGSVTKYVPCTGCGGTCTVVCYTCGGGGRTNCGSCSAYGWFLISKRILLIGKPSYSVGVSGDIQSNKLKDTILENLNIDSIYKLTSYSTTRIENTNKYQFLYSGKTEVLKQCFSVKSLPYCIYTYSNPPVTFLTAHFFDDLFEKQLQTARTLKGIGAAEKSTLIRYIAELNETPLLKKAIRSIINNRGNTNLSNAKMIRRDFNNYISNDAAQLLSGSIGIILKTVSPDFHSIVWLLGTITAVIFSVFRAAKPPVHYEGYEGILMSIGITLASLVAIGVVSLIISDFIIKRRVKKYSFQHTVWTDNSEPFIRLMSLSVMAYIFLSIFRFFG